MNAKVDLNAKADTGQSEPATQAPDQVPAQTPHKIHQVKLSDDQGAQYRNTLAFPPLYYAVFPQRLATVFEQPELETIAYSSSLVDECLNNFGDTRLQAKPLQPGFLYLFVDGCLYGEYQVNASETDGPDTYQEIDLTADQGKDVRKATSGAPQSYILAPLNAEKVELGFSLFQWSWLRINSLGGLPGGSRYQGPVATGPENLVENDHRLKAHGNAAKRQRRAEALRRERLVNITETQVADALDYQSFDVPVKDNAALLAQLDSTLAEQVTEPLPEGKLVFGSMACVLPDPFSLSDELCYRYKLAWQLMPHLLSDLSNPNHEGEKAQEFPFATWFESALLINKEILNPQAENATQYFSHQLKDLRLKVHRANIEEALGVAKRARLVKLIELTKGHLVEFLQGSYGDNPYPSLQGSAGSHLIAAFRDYHFLPISTQAELAEQPTRERLLERIGHIITQLGEHPRSYDITLDGSIAELQQYHAQASQDPGLQWLGNFVSGRDPLWQILVPVNDEYRSFAEFKNDDVNEPDFFQVTRRSVQLVSQLIMQITAVSKAGVVVMEQSIDGMKTLMKTHAAIDITLENVKSNAEIYRQHKDTWRKQPLDIDADSSKQLLSQYLRKNKPVVFTELEGANVDTIRQQRAGERAQMEQNLAEQKADYIRSEQRALADQQVAAEDNYLDVKSRLSQEQQQQLNAIEQQRQSNFDANQAYNRQSVDMEKQIRQLENDQSQASVTLDREKNNLSRLQHQQTQAQEALRQQQSIVTEAQQETARLRQQKSQTLQAMEDSITKNQAYYTQQYGEAGAREMAAKMREAAEMSSRSYDSKIAAAESRLHQEQQRLQQRQSAADHYQGSLEQQQQAVNQAQQDLVQSKEALNGQQLERDQLAQNHQIAQRERQAELDRLNAELEQGDQQRQAQQNQEYGHLKQTKAQQQTHNQQRIHQFENEQQTQLDSFDTETENQVAARLDAEQAFEQEKAREIEKAKADDKLVFDLTQPGEEARMQQYNRLQAQQTPRKIAIVESREKFQTLLEQQALHLQGHSVEMPDADRWLLDATLLDPETSQHFQSYLERQVVFAIDTDQITQLETLIVDQNTASDIMATRNIWGMLAGALSVIEIANLHYLLQKNDGSFYGRLNVLGGVLDTNAAITSLAEMMSKVNVNTIRNHPLVKVLSRPLVVAWSGLVAGVASCVISSIDIYRTLYTNRGDDAWMAHGITLAGHLSLTISVSMATYAAYKGVAVGSITFLGLTAGVYLTGGLGLLVLGAYLAYVVWTENDDALEYAITHGPFGAESDGLEGELTEDGKDITFRFTGGRIIVDGESFILKRIVDIGRGRAMSPYFKRRADGNRYYTGSSGDILIGQVGQPVANRHFNDASELESYFQQFTQELDSDRFEDGVYNENNTVLDASLWRGKPYSGHSYYESLVNALYPLEVDLSVTHITEDYGLNTSGHGISYDRLYRPEVSGNKVVVKIKAPYFQAGKSELYFELRGEMDNEQGDETDYEIFGTREPLTSLNAKLLKEKIKDTNIQFDNDEQGSLNITFILDGGFIKRNAMRLFSDNAYRIGKTAEYYVKASLKHKKSIDTLWMPPLQRPEYPGPADNDSNNRKEHLKTEHVEWKILRS